MIYASFFDLLKKIALCDIKSPVQRMIKTEYPEEYKKLNEWVVAQYKDVIEDAELYKMFCDYMTGKLDEQAYLETILKWAARHDGICEEKPIDKYMAIHQFDPNANKLWAYYMQIITWVRSTFPRYRKEMKGLDWGAMFDEFSENLYETDKLEQQIHDLMEDDEIMKKSGIYRYVLSGDLRDLSFRTFDKKQKREAYERQKGICVHCGKHFELEEMEADHIKPWKDGGTTVAENCQMLCRNCNRVKGGK